MVCACLPRYDVDGDGVISTKDLYLASKFDVNGDGVLQEDEVEELRGQMITDILATYDDLPHAGCVPFRSDPPLAAGLEVALLLSKKIERDPRRLLYEDSTSDPRFGENALLTLVNLWRAQ